MKKTIAVLFVAAVCAAARAENIVPHADSVVTNMNHVCGAITGNLFSSEGIPNSAAVPTIIIKGEGTRYEITSSEQLRVEGSPDNAKKYYSIKLLDGACLWIADGVSPKCNVFTVGEDYPWRSKDANGNWKEGYAPGVIAFEGSGEIITGCSSGYDNGEYPLCYLFLKNGVIKYRQLSPTEGKAGDSNWGQVDDRAFFRPSYTYFHSQRNYKPCDDEDRDWYSYWEDRPKYELRRANVGDDEWNENNDTYDNRFPNRTQFWLLNNIELQCTKWWSRGIGTDGIRLESNNHLPVSRISNNWDVNDMGDYYENFELVERTPYEWQGYGKYAADCANWVRDYWEPDYDELTAGKYYLFANNSGTAGKEVSFDKFEDYWGGQTVGLRDSYEIRGEFNFRKDDEGTLKFMGTWLQACDATNRVTLATGLELVNDMEIFTGRGLTVDGNVWPEWSRQPQELASFPNAVTELDAPIVGGAHVPTLAKYENGTLRFTGNTKSAANGNDLWKLRIGEGRLEIGTDVTVSCLETSLHGDLKERPNRLCSLELYLAAGATLETRNVSYCDITQGTVSSCRVISTNGTVRLTGTGERAFLAGPGDAKVKLGLGSETAGAPALTLDVADAGAAYVFKTHMEGSGTVRKAGSGEIKFTADAISNLPKDGAGKALIGFEVNEGSADFAGADLGDGVTGPGEVRNATFAVTAGSGNAGAMPVCGTGANISKVTLTAMPESTTDFIVLGKFAEAQDATNFLARCASKTAGVIAGAAGEAVNPENLDLTVKEAEGVWLAGCVKMPFTDATTAEEIAAELTACADGTALSANITDADEYAEFRAWADGIEGGQKEVAKSATAWYSYALGQTALLALPPQEVTVGDMEMKDGESGASVSIVVELKDIPIGAGASAANLAKVLGVTGSQTPDGAFSEENVSVTGVVRLDGGKAKLAFGPSAANADATCFYMRVEVK